MMRPRLLGWLILLITAPALQAQIPPAELPDPAALEQVRQRAERMMNPVAFALEHRAQLRLTDAQVATLEPQAAQLGEAQSVARLRTQELMRRMSAGMSDPQAPVDAEAIRAAYRAKADLEADVAIRLMEVQRLVVQTLDAEQRTMLQRMQIAAALEMMRSLPTTPPR